MVKKSRNAAMKRKSFLQSVNWFEKFIELLVVVIGITLAFVVDRSYEKYRNRKEADLYLSSLEIDLKADLVQLDSLLKKLNTDQAHLKRFISLHPGKKIEPDSLQIYLQSLSNLGLFKIRQGSFRALQSSGKFDLMASFEMRRKMFRYYHSADELEVFQSALQNYFDRFVVPVLIENLDMKTGRPLDRHFFRSVKFRNIASGYWSLRNQQIELCREIRKKAEELKAEIERSGL